MSVNLTTLTNFNGTNGNKPNPTLIADANGDLFGTTYSGGANNDGTVFEIVNNGTAADPNYATAPTVLVSFNGANGSLPSAGLMADANGDLFGTTEQGGQYSDGTVFEIKNIGTAANPSYAAAPTIIASFNLAGSFFGPSPAYPSSRLVADANGDLFGITQIGGGTVNGSPLGTVFEIKNNGTAGNPNYATAPLNLTAITPGASAGLLVDAKGDLFGTTADVGSSGLPANGSVFELVRRGTASNPYYTSSVLVNFNGSNGSLPVGLVADANGDLFGTTVLGGSNNDGEVYEIKNNGTAANPTYATVPTVLVNFNGADGAGSYGNLIADAKGDLFGTTQGGGANNDGTVFEIQNNGTAANPNYATVPTILFSFNGANGEAPASTLIADLNGDLFGTTHAGGSSGDGTAFEIAGSGFVPVAVSGTAQEGQTLTAAVAPGIAVSSYQWQELFGSTWVNIGGATGSTYLVQPGDDGWQIRVQVTDSSGNSATSAATNAVLDAAGNQPVYDSANQTTIGNGLFQYVYGTATNTTVNSGGEQNVYVGGTTIGAIINAGGVQVDWGNDSGAAIDGGNQFVWGTATDATINSGTQYVESGGTANGMTVDGGQQIVVLDGVVTNTVLSGGDQYIYGATTADGTVIDVGSVQYLYSTATNTTINSGGSQNVYADATATGTTINTGGFQEDWGAANATTLAGGNQYVWGTASNTTVNSGMQFVGVGGSATGTAVDGGEQVIDAGATASGASVSSGQQFVYGTADGASVSGTGFQYVYGSVTNTTVGSGGEQNVYASGTAAGTTINAGGFEVDWGSDNNATINGGTQFVVGTASGAVVNSGTQYVETGGIANGTTIAGGTEHVWAGGTANGVTFGGSAGTLALDPSSALTGLISGFGSGDAIDLGFVSFSNTGTTLGYQANTSGPVGGTLTVTDGTNVATLALLGQYSAASFALSSDGNGGTFITDPSTTSQNQLAVPLHG